MKHIFKLTLIFMLCFLLNILTVKAQEGQMILCEYEKDGKKVAKIQFNPLTLSAYMPDVDPDPGQWMIQYQKKDSNNYEFFQWQASTIGSFDMAFYQGDIISWGKDKTDFPEKRKDNFACPKFVNIEYDGMWHRACFSDKGRCADNGATFEYNASLSTTSDTIYNQINDYAVNNLLKEYSVSDLLKEANQKYKSDNDAIMKVIKDKTKIHVKNKILPQYSFGTKYATPNFIKNIDSYVDDLDNNIDKNALLEKFIKDAEDKKQDVTADNVIQGAIIGDGVGKLPNATPEEKDKIEDDIDKAKDKVDKNNEEIEKINDAIKWAKTAKINVEIPDVSNETDCAGLLGPNVSKIIVNIFKTVQYAGPLLVVVLTILDFAKAVVSGEAEEMKKSSNKLIKRLIAAVLLFFVPLLCELILDFANITTVDNCQFR